MKKSFSLYTILGVMMIIVVSLTVSIHSYFNYIQAKERLTGDIKLDSQTSLDQLKNTIKPYIEAYSANEYEKLLINEMGHNNIFAIILEDYNMGQIIGQDVFLTGKIRDKNWDIVDLDFRDDRQMDKVTKSFYIQSADIVNEQEVKIGTIKIYSTDIFIKKELDKIIKNSILSAFLTYLILLSVLSFIVYYFVLKPISNITTSLNECDDQGIPKNNIPRSGSVELLSLSVKMNHMINTIKRSRKIEKELNERFELAMDSTKDGLWDWDPKTDKVYFSNTWKEMLGYKPNEIKNDRNEWSSRIHPEDKEKAFRDVESHLKGETPYYENIHRIQHKSGEWIWILDRGKALFDENGEPYRIIGFHTDITKQKEIENKLQEQKTEFETIFQKSKDGIAILDHDLRFVKFNMAYLDIMGFSEEEMLKRSCIDICVPEQKENMENAIEKVLKKGYVENLEISCLAKNEKVVTLNMSITILPDKKRFLVTTKDITRIKLLESQAKLASMGEMLANIAHQWRQPLSIITTYTSAIQVKIEMGEKISNETILNCADSVIKQANYLSSTIDDFRNFLKSEHTKKEISIVSTLHKTLDMVKPALDNNYITAVTDIEDDLIVSGSENELMQSFINIINNSKDAIKEKLSLEQDKYIFITTQSTPEGLQVEFRDNGGGIDEKIIDRVFEPYFTTKHQSIGTGIGLSMVHTILEERYKAKVTASNTEYEYEGKPQKGASVKILFNKA